VPTSCWDLSCPSCHATGTQLLWPLCSRMGCILCRPLWRSQPSAGPVPVYSCFVQAVADHKEVQHVHCMMCTINSVVTHRPLGGATCPLYDVHNQQRCDTSPIDMLGCYYQPRLGISDLTTSNKCNSNVCAGNCPTGGFCCVQAGKCCGASSVWAAETGMLAAIHPGVPAKAYQIHVQCFSVLAAVANRMCALMMLFRTLTTMRWSMPS